jgi:hypothetical protein
MSTPDAPRYIAKRERVWHPELFSWGQILFNFLSCGLGLGLRPEGRYKTGWVTRCAECDREKLGDGKHSHALNCKSGPPRCSSCRELYEDGHHVNCPEYVHEVGLVVYEQGEWLFRDGSYVAPSEMYALRCSCGKYSGKWSSREQAVRMFRLSGHKESGLKIVPEVRVRA